MELQIINDQKMLHKTKKLIRNAVTMILLEKNAKILLQQKLGPLYTNLSASNVTQTYNEVTDLITLALYQSYNVYMNNILKASTIISFWGLSLEGLRCLLMQSRFFQPKNYLVQFLQFAAKLVIIFGSFGLCFWILLKGLEVLGQYLRKMILHILKKRPL